MELFNNLRDCEDSKFFDVVRESDRNSLLDVLKIAGNKYFNSDVPTEILSDVRYDYIKDYVGEDEEKQIGAPERGETVELPVHLGSLDKVKTDDEIKKFGDIFPPEEYGKYCLMEKLDGISCLLRVEDGKMTLFSRGDGDNGVDISYFKDYIQFPSVDKDVLVRGELIMSKENFKKHSDMYSCARNLVSGIKNYLVSGTNKNIEEKRNVIADIEFVAYTLISEPPLKIIDQLDTLKNLGFKTVRRGMLPNLSLNSLKNALEKMKEISRFEIDGIVVQPCNGSFTNPEDGNPKYAIAFKMNVFVEAICKDVLWKVKKGGICKPRIEIEPMVLSGATITYLTGFNAKFISDNQIGEGAKLLITRSGEVIPHVEKVLSGTEAKMPDIPYEWNESGVDIIAQKSTESELEERIGLITKFFKNSGIKYLGEKTVQKLVEGEIDSVPKIFGASIGDISDLVGKGNGKRISTELDKFKKKFSSISESTIMGLSGVFEIGVGGRKLQAVIEGLGDVSIFDATLEDILKVKGIKDKTADKILRGIIEYKKFKEELVNAIGEVEPLPTEEDEEDEEEKEEKPKTLAGMNIVVTGTGSFDERIRARGGTLQESVTNGTNLVVVSGKSKSKQTTKIKKALEKGIKIMDDDDFEKEYLS
jgi:DNA ligase (NAD+)